MELEKRQSIALMRYGAIAQVVNGLPDGSASMSEYFRKVSEQGIRHPDGSTRHYEENTLENWYRLYCKGGFEALMPKGRSDAGQSRKLDDELRAVIRTLHHTHPRMPATEILRTLREQGSVGAGEVSESTVRRYIRQLGEVQEADGEAQEMRRYERPHINEVWCGDSSRAPSLKRKVYIIALLDDASRMIVGAGAFFEDNFVNLMAVAKSAVAKYGCPRVFNFDNGGPYKNQQMKLLAARIGSIVHYCKPYTPTAKAKIERWFRTLKDHWIAGLDMRQFHSLGQLEDSLFAYVHTYNTTPHHAALVSGRSVAPGPLLSGAGENPPREPGAVGPLLPAGNRAARLAGLRGVHRPGGIRSRRPFRPTKGSSALFPGYERDFRGGTGWDLHAHPLAQQT